MQKRSAGCSPISVISEATDAKRSRLRDLLPVTVSHTFDPEEVTTRSHRETDPRGVGLRTQDVDAIWDAVVHLLQGPAFTRQLLFASDAEAKSFSTAPSVMLAETAR